VFLLGIFPALVCCLSLGCGGGKTVRVSGTVKFKGQPVPKGKIYFMPDTVKGNSGPTGFADIRDGQFDTSSGGGRGSAPGAVVVQIEGFVDIPPTGEVSTKQLFYPYQTTLDLPKQASTHALEVPAAAEKGPQGPKGGPLIVP